MDTLSRSLHVSRTGVYRGLQELQAAGLLKICKRRGGLGITTSTLSTSGNARMALFIPPRSSQRRRATGQSPTSQTFKCPPQGRLVHHIDGK